MIIKKPNAKNFIAGILAATGTWMLVVNLREYLLIISPISNQYIIGIVLIIASGLIVKEKW